jgi:dTDP-4-amino-4,6-dideoxygalactose transaminase
VSGAVSWINLAEIHAECGSHDALKRVLESGRYVGGEEVEALEEDVARWMNRLHGVAVSSGTAALELALSAMGVGPGDEVIVPAVSFLATVGSVLRVGATPVIVDVLSDGPWIDPDAVEAALTPRTALIMPVHLFGSKASVPQLGVPLLDDACQAAYPGGPATGTCTALSFYPTKVLGGMGDGGMILTQNEALAVRLKRLRQHGCDDSGRVVETNGTNARLPSLLAAVLRVRMASMDAEILRRREIAAVYDSVLEHRAIRRDVNSPVSIYAFLHPRRDKIADQLREAGIPTAIYYSRLAHDHPAFKQRVRIPNLMPNAMRFCRQTLALPCYGRMSDSDVDRVVEALESVL